MNEIGTTLIKFTDGPAYLFENLTHSESLQWAKEMCEKHNTGFVYTLIN